MPTITVDLPESIIVKIRGRDMTVEPARFEDLTEFGQKVFAYGLGRWYNDKSAPVGKKAPKRADFATDKEFESAVNTFADECLANAVAVRNDNYAGIYAKERGASEPADPVAKAAADIAAERVRAALGRIVKDEWKVTPEQMAKAREFAAKHELDLSDAEKFLAAARKIVAGADAVKAEAKRRVDESKALADLI